MTLARIGIIASHRRGGGGGTCPDYTHVQLKLLATAYTPPTVGGGITLALLPCPYTPPTVV